MKQQQWKIQREVKEYPNGQNRWDRAYLLVLEIARSAEEKWKTAILEVSHASSDLCEGLDPASSPGSND
jgi:tRNA uridine 5-carbamoylmethylation protein Kti12